MYELALPEPVTNGSTRYTTIVGGSVLSVSPSSSPVGVPTVSDVGVPILAN